MSRPSIQNIKLNENLTLSECHPDSECRTINWWLYDERAGMNLGMREESRERALIEALEYWAERAQKYEQEFHSLKGRVDSFVSQFTADEEED